jgi:hypothetical protein
VAPPVNESPAASRYLEVADGSGHFQVSGKRMRAGPGIALCGYASPEVAGKAMAGVAIGCLLIFYAADAEEVQVHIGSAILILWLVIGGFAADQRGDYKEAFTCSGAATAAATILAGPLNYTGVDPRINCTAPHPSN